MIVTDGKYLSEAICVDQIERGKLNLIEAPVGCGKTYFALKHLLQLTTNAKRAVYLLDTLAGIEQITQHYKNVQIYNKNWREGIENDYIFFEEDKFIIMTYQKFGTLMQHYPRFVKHLELIVCDEMHNLFWPIAADQNRIIKEHPGLSGAALEAAMLAESHNYAALHTLEALCSGTCCYVVALTATPRKVLDNFIAPIYSIKSHYPLSTFTTEKKRTYRNLCTEIDKIEHGRHYMIYIEHIKPMKEYIEYARSRGLNANGIWSRCNPNHPMTEEQLALREYIIREQSFPPGLDVLFINKSCETSINICGEIEAVFVHTDDQDTIVQARGRYRGDLPLLCVYSQDEAKIDLPPEYLDVKLYREEKERLAVVLNIRDDSGTLKKWPTIHKRLSEQGYIIENHKDRRNYTIIHPQPTGKDDS